jgi:hypothetical protein
MSPKKKKDGGAASPMPSQTSQGPSVQSDTNSPPGYMPPTDDFSAYAVPESYKQRFPQHGVIGWKEKRWYVVVVGRAPGIYYDYWCVFMTFCRKIDGLLCHEGHMSCL